MKLIDLDPHWVGAGGEGVFQKGDKPCPCNSNAECRVCYGSGFVYEPAPERHGVGVSFLCPCAQCQAKVTGNKEDDWYLRVFVGFRNPVDGKEPHDPRERAQWERIGDNFETLTLRPSILRVGGCAWHGYVTNGEIETL